MTRATQRGARQLLLGLSRGRQRWLLASLALASLAAFSAVGLVATAGWLISASALAGIVLVAGGVATLEIFAPGAMIRAFALLRTLGRYGERLLVHELIFRVIAALRSQLFSAAAALPFSALNRRRRAQMLTRVMHDTECIENLHGALLIPLGAALIASLLAMLLSWLLLPSVFVLLLAAQALFALLMCMAAARWRVRLPLANALRRERFQQQLLELLAAFRELSFADADNYRQQQLLKQDAALADQDKRLVLRDSLREAALSVASWLIILAGLSAGAIWLQNDASGGAWLSLAILGLLAAGNLWTGLAEAAAQWPSIQAASRRLLRELDDKAPSDLAAAHPAHRQAEPPAASPASWQLRAVHLRRGVADSPLFNALSLDIATGTRCLISGRSGSGKSTLGELLAGLREPDAGGILFNGLPLPQSPEAQRLGQICLLTQDTVLLSASLRDNLRLANTALDDDTLQEALRDTGLGYLPLSQWIGANGRPLSGGEARRVALIRCVLSNAQALILDEPFRGLDRDSAEKVAQWIDRHLAGRTLVLLDHGHPCALAIDREYQLE